MLVSGLTGAHKTTALILPVLLDAAGAGVSVVAFDLKYGERDSLAVAVPQWWRHGRDVLVFAPLNAASLRWNPLASCRSPGGALELAQHLFPDGGDEGPDVAYWAGAERHVCAALAWAVASDGGPCSIGRLRQLAEAGPDAVHAYVRRHPQASDLSLRLGAYRAMLPKDQAGILQGIAAKLEAWIDERVGRSTAARLPRADAPDDPGCAWDEIDIDVVRRRPTLLIVGAPQAALPRLRGLCQLFMRRLTMQLLRPRDPDDHVPVLYVLEELPAWGPLPGLADHLATFRSRNVAILATAQSEAQGQTVYGSAGWAAVAANFVTKIYFPSLADPDAERLSRALGTAMVHQVSHSRAWDISGPHDTEHTRPVEIPLRRPEALQGIDAPDDEVVVRCPRLAPARLWCPPFHVRSEYRDLVPDAAPSTLDIALRHRVAYDRRHPGVGTMRAASTGAVDPPETSVRKTEMIDDAAALVAFVEALLEGWEASNRSGAAPAASRLAPRVLCRGDRPIEVRLDPAQALGLLGHGDKANATVRRWAARRWVKQVRPIFVLEGRALDAVDQGLRQRLLSVHNRSPRPTVVG